MKKTISWLLLVLLLLVGCTAKAPTAEEKIPVNVSVQPKSATEAPVDIKEEGNMPQQNEPAKDPAVSGYEDFMSLLSAAVIDGKGNKNLSPVSVYLALTMAAEGAQGDTQAELLALLGEKDMEELRRKAQAMLEALVVTGRTGELDLANSIWLGTQDETVKFQKAFLKVLADSYGANAEGVPFGKAEAGERIAAWIREKTKDKVKISEDAMRFDADTLAVLLNTIYLKDGWRKPFDKDYTENGPFHGLDGQELQVAYMRQTDSDGFIFRGSGYLRYSMPLNDVGNVVFVLPDEGVSLDSLLGSPEKIRELLHGGEKVPAIVNIKLPKFTFQDRTDLEQIMMDLGVITCFTDNADFSAMTDTPAHISRVLQESCIGMDEDGVVAAAYTMVAMAKSSISLDEREKVDFHLTRPFLYAIERWDGTVLFIGTVVAPVE